MILRLRNFKTFNPGIKPNWPYRRLYRNVSPGFAQLSVFAKGIALQLIQSCEDDGTIDCGARHPAVTVAILLRADRRERPRVKTAVEELLRDRFLLWENEDGTPADLPDFACVLPRVDARTPRVAAPMTRVATVLPRVDAVLPREIDASSENHSDAEGQVSNRSKGSKGSKRAAAPPDELDMPSMPSDFVLVRDAYFGEYENAYGDKPSFGKKEGGQIQQLLAKGRAVRASDPAGVVCERIRQIYHSPPPWLSRGGGRFDLGTILGNFDRVGAVKAPGQATAEKARRAAEAGE